MRLRSIHRQERALEAEEPALNLPSNGLAVVVVVLVAVKVLASVSVAAMLIDEKVHVA